MANGDDWQRWQQVSGDVREEFGRLADAARSDMAMAHLDRWMREDLFAPQRGPIFEHVAAGQHPLLLDSFYQFIPFGTGGRRGRVGFGPNRLNEATVALSIQGHCNYLRQTQPEGGAPLSVVVACDVRIFKDTCKTYAFLSANPVIELTSRKLAKIACEIYAASGIRSYFVQPESDEGYLSTPELSFLIRRLGAAGGINVSASHNHPDDNGYKFFNTAGAQDIPPFDEELASFMEDPGEVHRISFEEGCRQGLVTAIPHERHEEYLDRNLAIERGAPPERMEDAPPIVYTPLCGTGTTTVAEVLRAAEHNVVLHEPQSNYDGTFASVPFHLPNPEVPEAAWPAIETAEAVGASVVLSSDPDADRLGVLVKGSDGTWVHLNGNEIASIISYYLIIDKDRGPCRKGLVITTVVSSGIIERIARQGDCDVVSDLLVGFKFVAEVLDALEKSGRFRDIEGTPDSLILAAEESHGFLLMPQVHDKDAAGAALVLCDLATKLHREGRGFLDYLDEIAAKCSNFANANRAILMSGMKGTDELKRLMHSLRSAPPERIGQQRVLEFRDYLADRAIGQSPQWPDVAIESSEDKANNLLVLRLEKGRVIIRPSGTEPKVKIYAEVESSDADRAAAKRAARELATASYAACLARLGSAYALSSAAGLIPDHVEMDLKKAFDADFAPKLMAEASALAEADQDELFAWLRRELDAYGGGSDPLDAMRPALRELCGSSETTQDEQTRASLAVIADRLTAPKGA